MFSTGHFRAVLVFELTAFSEVEENFNKSAAQKVAQSCLLFWLPVVVRCEQRLLRGSRLHLIITHNTNGAVMISTLNNRNDRKGPNKCS